MRFYARLWMTIFLVVAAMTAAAVTHAPNDDDDDNRTVAPYDGIDVSNHQKRIDWAEVAKDKHIKYVYIKATEGATYVCDTYRTNLEGARRHGIKVGAYHFLRTGSRIRDQFANFKRVVIKSEQDLLPLIDVEVRQGWTNQQLRDSVKLFADLVEEHYGCRPMIYTSSSFYDNILGRSFNIYPLFIARYSNNEPNLKSGVDWILWQFTEKGRVRGISTPVDLGRFNKGRSVNDIMIRHNRLDRQRRSNSELVDRSAGKPQTVAEPKEAPRMSKQQEKELKKQQEKERKARERAEKLAREEEKRKAEIQRKAEEKERKRREHELKEKQKQAEKLDKQNRKEQEHQRQLQEAARKKAEQEEAKRKQASEAELEKRQRIQQLSQQEQQRRSGDTEQAVKQSKNEQRRQLRRQQLKASQKQSTKSRGSSAPAEGSTKHNKSSVDNE